MSDYQCQFCSGTHGHTSDVQTHDPVKNAWEILFVCSACLASGEPHETYFPMSEHDQVQLNKIG